MGNCLRYKYDYMLLVELFDTVLPYHWVSQDDKAWFGKFSSAFGVDYDVAFLKLPSYWIVSFELTNESATRINAEHLSSVTGSGNQFKVFGTFLKMLNDLIKEVKPSVISFTSRGSSRTRMYQKMFSRVAGYKLSHQPLHDDLTQFRLTALPKPRRTLWGLLKRNVTETMDRPLPYNWEFKDGRVWEGSFTIGDVDYSVFFCKYEDEQWEVEFRITTKSQFKHELHTQYGITGTGNQFKVFSTFLRMLQDLIDNEQPRFIFFNSNEPSRTKLYRRMFANIPGYKLSELIVGSYRSNFQLTQTQPNKEIVSTRISAYK